MLYKSVEFGSIVLHIMDQISIKSPNFQCCLFLKIDQSRYLVAGVYLSETPTPPPYLPLHTVRINTPELIHREGWKGG